MALGGHHHSFTGIAGIAGIAGVGRSIGNA
jgi:hypothetical protein